jgi:hypothetical protein
VTTAASFSYLPANFDKIDVFDHGLNVAAVPSRDDLRPAKTNEQVEETLVGRLIVEEAKLPAFAHVGDHFDWTPKIGIGVLRRGDRSEIRLHQIVLARYFGPKRPGIGKLALQWFRLFWICSPNQPARRDHIQLQRKMSPLTTLKA